MHTFGKQPRTQQASQLHWQPRVSDLLALACRNRDSLVGVFAG
jgi:hypothetical protein